MYLRRTLSKALDRVIRHFPAVIITGPRQSGKTTFLRHEAPKGHGYVSFDDPAQRESARRDPNAFLNQFGERTVVLDEIQYVPELFSYLKIRIDQDRQRHGRFLLTGSQQFSMMRHVSDSLAGRIAILELLPFSSAELQVAPSASIKDRLWFGGYPELTLHPASRDDWLRAYIAAYVERDVRQLLEIRHLEAFETFLGLCAARHAQVLNYADLARDCGMSIPTCRTWESILQASYITQTLRPFHTNFGKRLIKSHKLFFTDPAICSYITHQPGVDALWHGPSGGSIFEGWIVMEAFKFFAGRGRRADLSFWRSHDGTEIDLLVEAQGRIFPVEIKQNATPRALHAASIDRFRTFAGKERCGEGIVVCTANEAMPLGNGVTAIPWHSFSSWLENICTS